MPKGVGYAGAPKVQPEAKTVKKLQDGGSVSASGVRRQERVKAAGGKFRGGGQVDPDMVGRVVGAMFDILSAPQAQTGLLVDPEEEKRRETIDDLFGVEREGPEAVDLGRTLEELGVDPNLVAQIISENLSGLQTEANLGQEQALGNIPSPPIMNPLFQQILAEREGVASQIPRRQEGGPVPQQILGGLNQVTAEGQPTPAFARLVDFITNLLSSRDDFELDRPTRQTSIRG